MERNSIAYRIRRKGQVIAQVLLPDAFLSKIYYRLLLHKKLDLKHPKSFNEKLQWLKLYYYPKNQNAVKCSDKYEVRGYIEDKGYGHTLVPLIDEWKRPEEINWDLLPEKFILKCNHGCAYNIMCLDKRTFDREHANRQLTTWLKEDFGRFNVERHYSQIKVRRIICEELLSECITDYKFFCFNGKAHFINVCNDSFHDRQSQLGFFYLDGKKMPIKRNEYIDLPSVEFPTFFDEMKEMAEVLAKEFPFVRADFFVTKDRFYFSELTFTPGACMMPFNPESADLEWGKLLDISKLIK